MVKNSFVCILNYVSGFCARKHKYTHTETQFTQHEASLDIERVLSQLIGCTLRLDTPNYILFIKFASKRFLLISVHQNHLCSPLWDNFCNYIWSEIISKVNNTLQKKPHYFNLFHDLEWYRKYVLHCIKSLLLCDILLLELQIKRISLGHCVGLITSLKDAHDL